MYGDHPPAFGDQHPWHDPLAPQDLFDPRPDAELAFAGGLAPDPQAFPFTAAGRADYYAAVRSVAHQMQMTQAAHAMQTQADQATYIRAREAEARRVQFLLLCP
jgi:hypothetical protein